MRRLKRSTFSESSQLKVYHTFDRHTISSKNHIYINTRHARRPDKTSTLGNEETPTVHSTTQIDTDIRTTVANHLDRYSRQSEKKKSEMQKAFVNEFMDKHNNTEVNARPPVQTPEHTDATSSLASNNPLSNNGPQNQTTSGNYERWIAPSRKDDDSDDMASLMKSGLPEWVVDAHSERLLNELYEEVKNTLSADDGPWYSSNN